MSQPQPDYDSWLPMSEVTRMTGMSERTVYRQVNLGKLRAYARPIPGRKPLSVFNPDDVAKLAESALKARPEILPAMIDPARDQLLKMVHQEELSEWRNMAGFPPSELRFIGYLSIQEAMRFTGLPEKTVQRAAREGRVQKIGTRYRRKDLEAL